MSWSLNPAVARSASYPDRLKEVLSLAAHRVAFEAISGWPGYAPTPLRSAARLASRLGVAEVLVKDESGRFGLGSFKALGGAYGVLLACGGATRSPGARGGAPEVGDRLAKDDGGAPEVGSHGPEVVACASDGNHGRAVAWGAGLFGVRAVVYLPGHVTERRAQAIRSLGAQVVRVDGEYDDAVARAAGDAAANGWTVVSDTSWEGYEDIPSRVMQGYTVMVEEAVTQMGGRAPTHVFVQGGVGGLAAAVVAHLWERFGNRRPFAVVVEPTTADGLYRSALAGRPVASPGTLETIMAGLSCRKVSPLAWKVASRGVHAFAAVADDGVAPLMRAAAQGELGDAFEGGESGVAGLLGLIETAERPDRRVEAQLDGCSRVLVFNTEGATDPELYRRIVQVG